MRLRHRHLHKLFRTARPALFLSKTSIDTVKNETPASQRNSCAYRAGAEHANPPKTKDLREGFLATNEAPQKGSFAMKNLGFPHSLERQLFSQQMRDHGLLCPRLETGAHPRRSFAIFCLSKMWKTMLCGDRVFRRRESLADLVEKDASTSVSRC